MARRPHSSGLARALLGAALVLGLAPGAGAEPLIRIPTADRVEAPTLEYRHRVDGRDEGYGTLSLPLGLAYELDFGYFADEDGSHNLEGGVMFQLLPDQVITPGIALGVWDVTNDSPWGRRGFLVVTKALRPGQFFVRSPLRRVQFTAGTGTGRFSGFIGAVRADLPLRLSLVAEFDARRLNAGVWFTPVRPLTLKAEWQNGNPYLGGSFLFSF